MKIYSNNIVFQDIVNGIIDYLSNCIQVDIIDDNDDDVYIMFGLNTFTQYSKLPKNYIAVQMEQTGVSEKKWFSELYISLLNGALEVWDYSMVNINNLKKIVRVPLVYMPLTYMKHITKSNRLSTVKDIDVLFMGQLNDRRQEILNAFKNSGINVYVPENYNLWDAERDNIVARSKILLNIHYYNNAILETARLSYVLSLGECLVVTESSVDKLLDNQYKNVVEFCYVKDELIRKCARLLELNDEALKKRINTCFTRYKIDTFNVSTKTLSKFSKSIDVSNLKPTAHLYLEPQIGDDGNIKLPKMSYDDLPYVSIVTITKNRKKMFELPIRNFYEFVYPKDKLEWVIIDDGDDNLKEVLPHDKRVKYVRYSSIDSLCKKRDIGVQQSSYDTILFMDDDDYYFPCSVYARVVLMKHYRRDCIGCLNLGVYDITNDNSFLMKSNFISEASLGFTRKFWKQRHFGSKDSNFGESYLFLDGREKEVINMPYFFNLIAITHGNNVTENLRTYDGNNAGMDNFFNMWDNQTQLFFLNLLKRNVYNTC